MRFSLPKKDLHRMLMVASRGAADDKTHIPALSHIRIRVRDGRVRCEATTIYAAVSIETFVSTEGPVPTFNPGEILAPKDLTARVASMPDGLLQLRLEGSQIVLTSHTSKRCFQMSGLQVDWSHNLKLPDTKLTLPTATLLKLFSSVEHAISTDETRGHMNSAFVEWTTGAISAVATDGHRLTYVSLPVEGLVPNPTGTNEMLIRRNDVRLFRALLEQALHEEKKEIDLHCGGGTAGLVFGDIQSIVKLTDGGFLPWQQVLPPQWKRRFVVDRTKLLDTISAVMLTDRETTVLEVKSDATEMFVSAATASSGDAGDAVPIGSATIDKGIDTAFTLKVSPKYMKEAIGGFDGDQITLCINGDGRDQVMFVRADEPATLPAQAGHLSIIMPMK